MLYAIYQNQDVKSQIEYVFSIILCVYGTEYQIMEYSNLYSTSIKRPDLIISYGKQKAPSLSKNHIHIYASDFFDEDYLKPASMPERPLKRYGEIPVVYSGHGEFNGFVRESDGLIETNIDIIASSFFMLSRYEEVVLNDKDDHSRFPANASLAYNEGFLHRPIVNEYIELLWSWIHSLMPDLERKPLWPQNKEFAVCLTHDIDSLRRYSLLPPVRTIGVAILKQRRLGLSLKIAADYLATRFHLKKDPFDTFDYMLSLEREYRFKSSFYFIAAGGSTFDGRYSISDPKAVNLIRKIESEGCEVGLHASYNSYNNLEKMASEKEKLDRIVSNKNYGCRQHYLRWKTPDTWRIQEKLCLLYDATLSFADHTGFKCGTCLPFKPFDVAENRRLEIWELPLTVMDGSLIDPRYQNLPFREAYDEIIRCIEPVRKSGGVFVLLLHNHSLDPLGEWPGCKEVYEKVIQYISDQNAFVSSGEEIIKWWTKRLHTS